MQLIRLDAAPADPRALRWRLLAFSAAQPATADADAPISITATSALAVCVWTLALWATVHRQVHRLMWPSRGPAVQVRDHQWREDGHGHRRPPRMRRHAPRPRRRHLARCVRPPDAAPPRRGVPRSTGKAEHAGVRAAAAALSVRSSSSALPRSCSSSAKSSIRARRTRLSPRSCAAGSVVCCRALSSKVGNPVRCPLTRQAAAGEGAPTQSLPAKVPRAQPHTAVPPPFAPSAFGAADGVATAARARLCRGYLAGTSRSLSCAALNTSSDCTPALAVRRRPEWAPACADCTECARVRCVGAAWVCLSVYVRAVGGCTRGLLHDSRVALHEYAKRSTHCP